ncbi:MAG: amidohydrolase family protein [Dehalococcoidia bacterium]
MPKAIDFHVHVPREPGLPPSRFQEAMDKYFKSAPGPKSADEMAAAYEELDMMAIIFDINTQSISGEPSSSNDYVAGIVKKYPDRFIGFATVDPWTGKLAIAELERNVKELGLKGLKLHPNEQEFFPNDRRFYPIYEKCAELKIPLLFHSGHAGTGAGMPGGGGIKLKYSAPIPYVDDVAADFPELTIIMAHPGWPWQEEQIAVALHKPNTYIDLSGWSPKYFPPSLIQFSNTLLQDKVLFGSDYPAITPQRWLKDFEAASFKDEVRPKILLENAKKLLGL